MLTLSFSKGRNGKALQLRDICAGLGAAGLKFARNASMWPDRFGRCHLLIGRDDDMYDAPVLAMKLSNDELQSPAILDDERDEDDGIVDIVKGLFEAAGWATEDIG